MPGMCWWSSSAFSSGAGLDCRSVHNLHTGAIPQLSSALHQILVKVNAKQAADELAGRHPPGKKGKDPSKEDGGEDGT